MNNKTQKLMQIADTLRLAENLIREFNSMGETDIVSAQIMDDFDPIKIHLYGDVRHEIGLDFIDYPTKDMDTFFVTEHGARTHGAYIFHADYANKKEVETA